MAVSQAQIRDILLPGLYSVTGTYSTWPAQWEVLFAAEEVEAAAPLLSLPVSLPAAVAIGAAAVVIKNPAVTRRFWSWFNSQ